MNDMTSETKTGRNDWLQSYWMPFTPNKAFKAAPRINERAEGFYYHTSDGRKILDSFSGLWCCNLGHRHPKISEAMKAQIDELDYSNAFNFGHPKAFELANVVSEQFPGDLDHVFFVNSGSEAADTALKIAIAYHRARGEGTRTRLIGRVHGYHGVGFGGISVGGMVNNRKFFGSLLPGADHLSFPYDMKTQAFTRGESGRDVEPFMSELEGIITLHDASTIAAVMVEPFAGSGGVFVPPKNYLRRLREVTQKHGILLIVDEVISGFGRMGAANASTHFGVEPDIVTVAKGINNGAVPMGAAIVRKQIYDTFMDATPAGVEFFQRAEGGHGLGFGLGAGNGRSSCVKGWLVLDGLVIGIPQLRQFLLRLAELFPLFFQARDFPRGRRQPAGGGLGALFRRGGPQPQGRTACDRHPQYRSRRRGDGGHARRRAGCARRRGLPQNL